MGQEPQAGKGGEGLLSPIFADPKFLERLVAPLKLKPTEVLRKVGYET